MAPLCADPRQIVIALNPARRAALLHLIEEITAFMTLHLANPSGELGSLTGPDEEAQDARPSARPNPPAREAKAAAQKPAGRAAQQIEEIQEAAMKDMKDWKSSFLPKLEEIVRVQDTAKIKEERKIRQEALDKRQLDTPEEGENLMSFGNVQVDKPDDVAALQKLYHPILTRLTTVPAQDRREALSCVLLLVLSTGKYSAHSRTMILHLASALEIPQTFVNREEAEVARSLMESSAADKHDKDAMSAEAEAEKRRQQNKFSRFWKVGLASVAGAAVIGVTGGLAAPLVAGTIGSIMGGVGLGGVASFLGIFWMNGALVGALFGAYGAKMTGELMDRYAKEVEDFKFIPLAAPVEDADGATETRRLRVTIGINGWLNDESDIVTPWRVLPPRETEVFALRYEMKTLLSLGTALQDLAQSFAWKTLKMEIIKRTVLATLWAALWPIQVLAAASNVDNPFSRASNRSKKAGRLLADALTNRVQGERPVTLIGYSLGATAIHACLESLAQRKAFGLVDTVVIMGAPAPSDAAHWRTLRCAVSGPIFNVYSENDMMLGFVYRMHSLALGVAGLQAIDGVHGIQNLDLSEKVSGHLRYPSLTGEILKACGFTGVRAGGEIQKDDLIRMKDDHAEGKLIDLDAAGAPPSRHKHSPLADDDLRGLTISPPALSPRDAGRRPRPARPAETEPKRENENEHQHQHQHQHELELDSDESPVTTQHESLHEGFHDPPSAESGSKSRRQQTPDSNDGDDGEFMAIKMEDNDDDHGKPVQC
ncbi:transmembrane and coiled-coil domains 4 [Metarhizium album ARSEF 1941]|uniref:Transmembrane and coiled-coil domains 4 n=1 Tax=Metarhizium album (strain ARSEF 1941) TaxID=1081103 RepID=A0A0B2WS10_METAS|nr:transmembrane and coiled-coil domains 4 [Metarhizium album ARSEF 1941]KHN96803.1 transmembrane and coiled-coil domains 4 [Metarhizium album ARSEF 1941]